MTASNSLLATSHRRCENDLHRVVDQLIDPVEGLGTVAVGNGAEQRHFVILVVMRQHRQVISDRKSE